MFREPFFSNPHSIWWKYNEVYLSISNLCLLKTFDIRNGTSAYWGCNLQSLWWCVFSRQITSNDSLEIKVDMEFFLNIPWLINSYDVSKNITKIIGHRAYQKLITKKRITSIRFNAVDYFRPIEINFLIWNGRCLTRAGFRARFIFVVNVFSLRYVRRWRFSWNLVCN